MQRSEAELERAVELAGRIISDEPRRLFCLMLEEIARFPGSVTVETTPFEARCAGEGGFSVTITPYRELFLVSVGEETPCTLRVTSERDYCSAIDLTLQQFLQSRNPL